MSIGTIDIHTYNQYFNIGVNSDNLNNYGYDDSINDHNAETTPVYVEAFPALPVDEGKIPMDLSVPWNNKRNSMSVRSSVITQVFSVPLEDRQFKNLAKSKIYQNIIEKTGVMIETSQSKDSSISIVLTGKQENVIKARKLLLPQLQIQVQTTIQIPQEYYPYLLGAKGKKLSQIEADTSTKINLPKIGSKSDIISIFGDKYGVEKAKEQLLSIYEQQAKLASLQLDIPKCYHIFICGVGNENLKRICEKNGVKIIVPPYHSTSEQIFISGEKQAVLIAEAEIMAIYQEMYNTCQEVQVQVKKSQHKYLIGPKGTNINEIFADIGVSVVVPPQNSDSETVVLRGNADKLGVALTAVYAKANSKVLEEFDVPNWLHRFIIGQHGSEIKKISANYPKVNIEFVNDKITVEGPTIEALQVKELILTQAQQLSLQMAFFELIIDPKYFSALKRSSGLINRIRTGNNVLLRLPDLDGEQEGRLRIEGSPEAVSVAKQQIVELISKLENEVTLHLNINNSLIRLLIGSNGRRIKELNARFPDICIIFPDNTEDKISPNAKNNAVILPTNTENLKTENKNIKKPVKKTTGNKIINILASDDKVDDKKNVGDCKVIIRGPQPYADQCLKYLQLHVQDVADKHHRVELRVPKELHRLIIGKNGITIKKLCEDTTARIDLPSEDSNSEIIVISGEKLNVEKAKKILDNIIKEQSNIIEEIIDLPTASGSLNRIRFVKSVVEALNADCSKPEIKIHLNEKNGAIIRGPKELIGKAKASLLNILNEKSFTAEVEAPANIRGLLIGRNGSALKKITSEFNVEIFFAPEFETNEIVTIIGAENDVQNAKKKLLERIESLTSTIETEIFIDPKHQKLFLVRNRDLINRICEECGDVNIVFPRAISKSSCVVLKGKKTCVEDAIQKINEAISKMETAITIEVSIPRKYHKILMGTRGNTINQLTRDHDVNIIMPEKILSEDKNVAESSIKSKGIKETVNSKKNNIRTSIGNIIITSEEDHLIENQIGQRITHQFFNENDSTTTHPHSNGDIHENVITDKINNNGDIHLDEKIIEVDNLNCQRDIAANLKEILVSEGSIEIDKLMKNDKVENLLSIQNSNNNEEKLSKSDIILISGQSENCENAKKTMLAMIPLKKEFFVAKIYHPYIIGPKGTSIKQLMQDHRVSITVPPSTSSSDMISILGSAKNIDDAEKAILLKIGVIDENRKSKELHSYSEEVEIDSCYHTKLIGRNGKLIGILSKNFDVNVKFPDRSNERNNFVVVKGLKENVEKAKVELLKKIEEMKSQMTEKVNLDSRIHPRIIGAKGKNIVRLTQEYNVDLKFPGRDATNKDIVIVTGLEENVKDCIDHLLDLQDEYLQDIKDKEILENQRNLTTLNSEKKSTKDKPSITPSQGFIVRDAPWAAPIKSLNKDSMESFPMLSATNLTTINKGVWALNISKN